MKTSLNYNVPVVVYVFGTWNLAKQIKDTSKKFEFCFNKENY